MSNTYLSTDQLAGRLPYSPRTIRDDLKDSVLIEGIHYIRPFGRRKILYIWEAIESDLLNGFKPQVEAPIPVKEGICNTTPRSAAIGIPMANGGHCHG